MKTNVIVRLFDTADGVLNRTIVQQEGMRRVGKGQIGQGKGGEKVVVVDHLLGLFKLSNILHHMIGSSARYFW